MLILIQLIPKFHPDKNKSEFASDAFKKISHIFQVLNNKEKRDFYDKYGPEEDVKEQLYKERQAEYEKEMDEYELYNLLFNINMSPEERRRRAEMQRRPISKLQMFIQMFLPLIMMIVIYILPHIYKEVLIFI